MSLYKRLHEIQTPDPTLTDPTMAHGPVPGSPDLGLPSPIDTAPQNHPIRSLAMTALAGVVAYKSAERLGTPAEEVVQFGVLPAAVAVTGLRGFVTDRRIGHNERALRKAETPKKRPDGFIMRRINGHKQIRGGRKLFEAGGLEGEVEMDKVTYGRGTEFTGEYLPHWDPVKKEKTLVPVFGGNDFGTPTHERRLMRSLISRDRRKQLRSIREYDHEHHEADKLRKKASRMVGGKQKVIDLEKKLDKLDAKKARIVAREDRVSRVYDYTKGKVTNYANSRASEVKKDWDESMAGYGAVLTREKRKALYQEGRYGVNVPDTRKQRVLNVAAKGAGKAYGRAKKIKVGNVYRRGQEKLQQHREKKAASKTSDE